MTLYADISRKTLSSSAEGHGAGRDLPGRETCLWGGTGAPKGRSGGECRIWVGSGVTETGRNGPGAAVSKESTISCLTRQLPRNG